MSGWVFCQGDFIEADVIRWKEPIWENRGPRQGRAVRIGDRLVTAEVLAEDEETGWVTLLVLDCDNLSTPPKRMIALLARGVSVRRKRKSLEIGRPERLLWTDEAARADLAGAALRERPPTSGVRD